MDMESSKKRPNSERNGDVGHLNLPRRQAENQKKKIRTLYFTALHSKYSYQWP